MLRVVFLIVACCAGSFAAPAQTMGDVELAAAYCFGATSAQSEMERQNAETAKEESVRGLHMWTASLIEERLVRFRDYLKVKGLLDGEKAVSAKLAADHGRSDVLACKEDLEGPLYGACPAKCAPLSKDGAALMACNNKCPKPPSCDRLGKCLENFLPF
jgi:hypothetical protein